MRQQYRQFRFGCLLTAMVCGLATPPLLQGAEPEAEDPTGLDLYFSKEQLVESATRYPISMAQVAENFSIISAEQIADSHAHNLLEILRLQAGLFTPFFNRDFGGSSHVFSQGTHEYHTLVLIDGIRLNDASGGTAHLEMVPLGIIKRIEIIKGPASSTWGSALGGVINVITKDPGTTPLPKGNLLATVGKANSHELSGDLSGKNGAFSYFLHGGRMESDGLELDRFFNRDTAFAKTQFDLPNRVTLTAEGGFSNPAFKTLNFPDAWGVSDLNLWEQMDIRHFWGTAYLHAPLNEQLQFNLALQRYDMRFFQEYRSLGSGIGGNYGSFIYSNDWDEATTGVNGSLTWNGQQLSGVVGVENLRSRMDYTSAYGVLWGPSTTEAAPGFDERRGFYSNLTARFGKLSLTPGVRYDYTATSDSFLSPSLGLVYQYTPDTLLRATVGRGFTAPYLSQILNNPGLSPETTQSYQAGVETVAIPYLHLKSALFLHELDDLWINNPNGSSQINGGKARLRGVEVEAETTRWHQWGLTANATYLLEDNDSTEDSPAYSANLKIDYDQPGLFKANVIGNYVGNNDTVRRHYEFYDNTVIWDASLTKPIPFANTTLDLFVVGHNLFNASNYWDSYYPNPSRWLEVGARYRF